MSIDTDVFFTKKDLGKNLYSKKTYYTVMIEQHVLANDSDDADKLFLDGGGIDYDNVNSSLAEATGGVETTVVDANYTDSDTTTFLGKVAYDEDDEYAEEDGSVVIDTNAEETSEPTKPTNRAEQKRWTTFWQH